MIVRTFEDRIELITQPDHAHLAGRIMGQCAPLAAHPRRDRILRAIREHDNGWTEADAAPAVDPATGAVVDFIHASIETRQSAWPRAVARESADPWVAALIAQHAITAYDRFRSDPDWNEFFTRMTSLRTELLQRSGLDLDKLVADYRFVRLGDLVSLAFCTNTQGELAFGEWTVRLAGTRVTVTPDAFAGSVVPFEIAARRLPRRAFGSDEGLHDALHRATQVALDGSVGSVGCSAETL